MNIEFHLGRKEGRKFITWHGPNSEHQVWGVPWCGTSIGNLSMPKYRWLGTLAPSSNAIHVLMRSLCLSWMVLIDIIIIFSLGMLFSPLWDSEHNTFKGSHDFTTSLSLKHFQLQSWAVTTINVHRLVCQCHLVIILIWNSCQVAAVTTEGLGCNLQK